MKKWSGGGGEGHMNEATDCVSVIAIGSVTSIDIAMDSIAYWERSCDHEALYICL